MSGAKRPLIVWGDPPAKQHAAARGLKYAAYVEALRERPGEWACLRRSENPKTLNTQRKSMEIPAYARLAAPHKLQLSVRKTDAGDYGLWARLVDAHPKNERGGRSS